MKGKIKVSLLEKQPTTQTINYLYIVDSNKKAMRFLIVGVKPGGDLNLFLIFFF